MGKCLQTQSNVSNNSLQFQKFQTKNQASASVKNRTTETARLHQKVSHGYKNNIIFTGFPARNRIIVYVLQVFQEYSSNQTIFQDFQDEWSSCEREIWLRKFYSYLSVSIFLLKDLLKIDELNADNSIQMYLEKIIFC